MKDDRFPNQIAAVPQNKEPASIAERRAHSRHLFSALAEVIEPRTHTRLTCRATDLSFGGIYVDTISPLPVGSEVWVRLTSEGRMLQARAKVTYTLNGAGMGLAFTPELSADQAAALDSWIAELSGDLHAAPPVEFDMPAAATISPERRPASSDSDRLRESTRELVELLLHKQILTESEASALRSKLVR